MNKIKVTDVIALLADIPDKKLIKGQVGTIVEILSDNNYEVEFCNPKGETVSISPVESNNLLLLHYEIETI
ncbi:MAG: DUF4926 domain-containing protein [Ignavibacteria bacterium]